MGPGDQMYENELEDRSPDLTETPPAAPVISSKQAMMGISTGDDEELEGEEDDDVEDNLEGHEAGGAMPGENTDGGAGEEPAKPKLKEGFFEVEAIRKKRICKGVAQYFIKWRGWPESANTWEPFEHLQTCAEVVEAYEEKLQSGKNFRKRKRKYTQTKKKMQYPYSSRNPPRSKVAAIKLPHHASISKKQLSNAVNRPPQSTSTEYLVRHDIGNGARELSMAKLTIDENDSSTISPLNVEGNDKGNGGEICTENHGPRHSNVRAQDISSIDGDSPHVSNVNSAEQDGSGRRRGARRRKSGAVQRFKQDSASPGNAISDKVALPPISMMGNLDGYGNNSIESSREEKPVTKLIKPISYRSSVSGNVQDVHVSFTAIRSDGTECVIDNKYLKVKNPLLLINFYEQYLRYNA